MLSKLPTLDEIRENKDAIKEEYNRFVVDLRSYLQKCNEKTMRKKMKAFRRFLNTDAGIAYIFQVKQILDVSSYVEENRDFDIDCSHIMVTPIVDFIFDKYLS